MNGVIKNKMSLRPKKLLQDNANLYFVTLAVLLVISCEAIMR